ASFVSTRTLFAGAAFGITTSSVPSLNVALAFERSTSAGRSITRIALAAQPGVSPAPATEQKQHHKNDQYGFHCCTSPERRKLTGLCNGRLTSSLHNIIEVAKGGCLITLDHFERSICTARHVGL